MSAEAGSSFGACGTDTSFRPASCGRRSPLRWFTSLADQTRFSQASLPPRERGTTWSRLPSSGRRRRPVYWHRLPSRSRIARAQSFGRFLGTLAKLTATITVGRRIAPRTVCTTSSRSRTGSVIHSSHVTGRTLEVGSAEWGVRNESDSGSGRSSRSISRAVATLVAIMQNASCGVRTLIGCQLRFSTSTVALVNLLLIQCLRTATGLLGLRCLFFVGACARKMAAPPAFAPRCLRTATAGFRDRRAPDYATRQWSAEP